jgi:hypothetical protein
MFHALPVNHDNPLCGTWSAPASEDKNDVRTQYTVSVVDEQFHVVGVDPIDGEEFLIFDVGYDGESLRFTSLMPSTQSRARVWMRIINRDRIECRWTITETEIWHRQSFPWKFVVKGVSPSNHIF